MKSSSENIPYASSTILVPGFQADLGDLFVIDEERDVAARGKLRTHDRTCLQLQKIANCEIWHFEFDIELANVIGYFIPAFLGKHWRGFDWH
jgi:hypothetical protein